jgi:hypothetical protein
MCLEHPAITEMNRKGYIGALNQPECCGSDWFGFEILTGDEIVEINGEVVLKEHLEDFLKANEFQFYTLAGHDVVEYDSEVILKEDLEDFLVSKGFEFKTAQ